MKRKNKITISILILMGIFICFNFYIKYQKKTADINKVFTRAVVVEDDRLIANVDVKIKGTLSDTHFAYKYLQFSQDLKGTVSIDNKKYYISASSVIKDGTIQGVLTKEKNNLLSDYEITLTRDLKEICIYKGDYIISAPVKTSEEAMKMYESIVNIPVD